jgi:pyruvate dehydrogenase E1 component alpha subunit
MREEHDPIEQVRRRLLGEWKVARGRAEVDRRQDPAQIVNEAADFATNDPEPDPSELWTDILH